MTAFLRDLRLGVRQLMRRPGFTAAAIASLALGIGLNTTLFSVVNAVLLRGGPRRGPDGSSRSTRAEQRLPAPHDVVPGLSSHPERRAVLRRPGRALLRARDPLDRRAAHARHRRGRHRELLRRARHRAAASGRGFRADENIARGAHPVLVLSHGLWQRRFGGRPDIVGQTVELVGLAYTVVGVAPASFTGTLPGIPTEFWVPVMMVERLSSRASRPTTDNDPAATRLQQRGTRWLFVKGRLADGRTVDRTHARRWRRSSRASPRTTPPPTRRSRGSVLPAAGIRFHPMLDGYVKAASAGLLAAVALVLVIACANVANMLLARGAARRRELAVRAAIGASRGRHRRQLLSEGLVLAAAGGVLGVLIAWWAGPALAGVGTDVLPVPVSVRLLHGRDGAARSRCAVSLATAVLFGLAPAWSASSPSSCRRSRHRAERARGAAASRCATCSSSAQLALSLVLLVAGALLTRGLLAARRTDLGFDPRRVSSLSFNLQMNGYDDERAMAFRERAVRTLRALPGVAGGLDGLAAAARARHQHGRRPRPGPPRRRTRTRPRSTRCRSAPTTSRPSACRSSRAARSPRTRSAASARSRSSTRPSRGSTGRTARRSGSAIYSGGFDSGRTRSSASRATTRCARWAKRRGRTCTCPRRRRAGIAGRPHHHAGARRRCRRCARRCSTLEPAIVFTEDAAAERGRGDDLAPTRIGAMAARRVRRARAAAGRRRPLRRHRLLGEPAHARDGRAHGPRRRAAPGAAARARHRAAGSRWSASASARSRPLAWAACSSRCSTA